MRFLLKTMLREFSKDFLPIFAFSLITLFINKSLEVFSTDTLLVLIGMAFFYVPIFLESKFWNNYYDWMLIIPIKRIHALYCRQIMLCLVSIIVPLLFCAILYFFDRSFLFKVANALIETIRTNKLTDILKLCGTIIACILPFFFMVPSLKPYRAATKKNTAKIRDRVLSAVFVLTGLAVFYNKWWEYSPLLFAFTIWYFFLFATVGGMFTFFKIPNLNTKIFQKVSLIIYLILVILPLGYIYSSFNSLPIRQKAVVYANVGLFLPNPTREEVIQILSISPQQFVSIGNWQQIFIKRFANNKKIDLVTDTNFDFSKNIKEAQFSWNIKDTLSVIDPQSIHAKEILQLKSIKGALNDYEVVKQLNKINLSHDDYEALLKAKEEGFVLEHIRMQKPNLEIINFLAKKFNTLSDGTRVSVLQFIKNRTGEEFTVDEFKIKSKNWNAHWKYDPKQCSSIKSDKKIDEDLKGFCKLFDK